MAALVSFLLFAVLMGAISIYGYRRYARPARVYEQLQASEEFGNPSIDKIGPDEPGLAVSVFQLIGEKLPISPQDVMATRRELISAGYRSEMAVAVLYGIKAVLCVTLVVLALLFRDSITSNHILRIVMVIAAGLVGYFGPGFCLESMVNKRREIIRLSLPDALDLMVVCVEAGLGLDQAIQYVSRELMITHPVLCHELSLVNLEMRAGKRRTDALRQLVDRTGEQELRKLVAILIQTDKFGTSMADSLRTHSDFMRVRRRQEAEERAGKVGVKLVFPIFFLILPAMLLVAAGPGLLQVFKYLFPMMREFRG
jgi:tight adherence protein C